MIKKLVLKNFRAFRDSTIEFNEGLNILVGDNEAGKSTVLEAINLGLTSRIIGKYLSAELSPHLFNLEAQREYVDAVHAGTNPELPEVVVELYLEDNADTARLRGSNNSLREDAPGLRVCVSFDSDYSAEYAEFLSEPAKVTSIPVEYFRVDWRDFSEQAVTQRSVKVSSSLIDASHIRLQSGSDYYLQRIIEGSLTERQRVQLARTYRTQQEEFAKDPAIGEINAYLNESKDEITSKNLTMEVDASHSSAWETTLTPHLDELPFQLSGNGEQNMLKILLALSRKIDESHVILIEEPENHLSFSSLNQLIDKIAVKCAGRQVIITTHSSYVLNKLGLEQLMLLSSQKVTRLKDLPSDTQTYFMKLSGYDTLRLVLAKKVVLVEGPSDELIVQKAYFDKYGHRPMADGVDVINIRGLSFKRFLDIAALLGRQTVVVTDNDGDPAAVDDKYEAYAGVSTIKVCRGSDAAFPTLEPQLVAANDLATMNRLLGRTEVSVADLVKYMTASGNKTECALRIHEANEVITMPQYIQDAISD